MPSGWLASCQYGNFAVMQLLPRQISRRTILRGSAGLLASSFFNRRGFASASDGEVKASIVVGHDSIGTIEPEFCGLSYEKSLLAVPFFSKQNERAVGLFNRLGPGNLRIGGNSVDRTQWVANGRGLTEGQVAPPDVDALAGFLKATGWSVLYGVNMATSTPALASAEIGYVSKALGNKLTGIEIGNEPDGYGGQYFNKEWDPATNVTRWQQFADAILKQTPDVALTGPGIGILNHVNSWTASFASAMAPQTKQLRQLTQHYYRADGHSPSSTMELLLKPDPNLAVAMKQLQSLSQRYRLPFRFTEVNSFYNGGAPGVSNACGSALWALDFLFQLAAGGAAGANFQDGGNFTRGYTVISHRDATIYGPQPEYYGLLLFTLAGTGTMRAVNISAEKANATAYAVENRNGTLNIVVINKDADRNLTATIQAGRAAHQASATLLTMPSLQSTEGIRIQGAIVGKDGSFSPHPPVNLKISDGGIFTTVNAGSAALIQVS